MISEGGTGAAPLTPELLAVEVAGSLSFDLDVAFDLALAGESHFVFMADVGKEGFRIAAELCGEILDHPRLRDVFLAFLDVHTAGTAHAETLTVQVLVETLVEFHAGLTGRFPQVGTFGNVNGFLLFDERDLRHGPLPSIRVLMPVWTGHALVNQPEQNLPGVQARNGTRGAFEFPDYLSGSDF